MVWQILGSIIAGGIIGMIARAIMPGKQNMSIPMTVGLGIAGMVIGNIVGQVVPPDNDGVPWILGVVFAFLILFVLGRTGNMSKVTR